MTSEEELFYPWKFLYLKIKVFLKANKQTKTRNIGLGVKKGGATPIGTTRLHICVSA